MSGGGPARRYSLIEAALQKRWTHIGRDGGALFRLKFMAEQRSDLEHFRVSPESRKCSSFLF
jgi:hypothetical protein